MQLKQYKEFFVTQRNELSKEKFQQGLDIRFEILSKMYNIGVLREDI